MQPRGKFTYQGQSLYLREIAEIAGVQYGTLRARIKRGRTLEEALAMPLQEQHAPAWQAGTKCCSTCKKVKPLSDFTRLKRRTGNEFQPACRECDNVRTKSTRLEVRLKLLSHYSNGSMCCEICGESRVEVLDLDHINGGGTKHRRQYKTNDALYKAVVDQGYPPEYRILCRNCNWIEYLKRRDLTIAERRRV